MPAFVPVGKGVTVERKRMRRMMNKFFGTGVLLVFCVALLTACNSTSHANKSQTSTSVSQVDMSTTKVVQVHIVLSDFNITSSLMTFRAGAPYHFTVTNSGKVDHELLLMSTTMKSMSMDGMPMKELHQMALASLQAMKPGITQTFDYTFALSTTGNHPELSCHLPKHYENGMHLDLTVL